MAMLCPISLRVNATTYEREVEPRRLLVDFLRHDLGLTGTHIGCETSQCGACVVLMNGEAAKSCTLLAMQANGTEITTIEGLAGGDTLHPVQESFRLKHGLQCGFCTPGMVMLTVDLLRRTPRPSEQEVRHALHGNICRCTGYQHIVDAVLDAAEHMAPSAAEEAIP